MKRSYSIGRLLKYQSCEIKKSSDFKYLINLYNHSENLKKARFGKKCYSLLQKAGILPENLDRFYHFYKIPRHSFFPLFLKLKKEHIEKINFKRKEKSEYILKKMRQMPLNIQNFIKNLANYEKLLTGKNCPIWIECFYPKTKKKVNSYFNYSLLDWLKAVENYLQLLLKKFKKTDMRQIKRISAYFILDLPFSNNSIEQLKTNFRLLSKKYHPDHGGDPEVFKKIKDAFDFLIKEGIYLK
ncbi:MAG: DnaJ domain-containing protein [Spirochaetes bacterium]|nr:DnaJ domain-containing protein [Spirochaetota bacterium]